MELAARLLLGGILVASAIAKITDRFGSHDALRTYGLTGRTAWIGLTLLIVAELAFGIGTIAGSDASALGAAALMLTLGAATGSALASGRAGEPCGCFGATSSVSGLSVARSLALAAGFAAVAVI